MQSLKSETLENIKPKIGKNENNLSTGRKKAPEGGWGYLVLVGLVLCLVRILYSLFFYFFFGI